MTSWEVRLPRNSGLWQTAVPILETSSYHIVMVGHFGCAVPPQLARWGRTAVTSQLTPQEAVGKVSPPFGRHRVRQRGTRPFIGPSRIRAVPPLRQVDFKFRIDVFPYNKLHSPVRWGKFTGVFDERGGGKGKRPFPMQRRT